MGNDYADQREELYEAQRKHIGAAYEYVAPRDGAMTATVRIRGLSMSFTSSEEAQTWADAIGLVAQTLKALGR